MSRLRAIGVLVEPHLAGRRRRSSPPQRRRAAAWSAAAAHSACQSPGGRSDAPAAVRATTPSGPAADGRRRRPAPTGSGSTCGPSRTTPRPTRRRPPRPRVCPISSRSAAIRPHACPAATEPCRGRAPVSGGCARTSPVPRAEVRRPPRRRRPGRSAVRAAVPTGPPSETGSGRHARTSSSASRTPASQPATRKPSVVGIACRRGLRQRHGAVPVDECVEARRASSDQVVDVPQHRGGHQHQRQSSTSWTGRAVVHPPGTSSGTPSRSARPGGPSGCPATAPAPARRGGEPKGGRAGPVAVGRGPSHGRGDDHRLQDLAVLGQARRPAGAGPTRAPTASPPSVGEDIEEDGLVGTLESHVETVASRPRPAATSVARGGSSDGEQAGRRRCRRVVEVDPGHDPAQHPAREHRHRDVRRLRRAVLGRGRRAGFTVVNVK